MRSDLEKALLLIIVEIKNTNLLYNHTDLNNRLLNIIGRECSTEFRDKTEKDKIKEITES